LFKSWRSPHLFPAAGIIKTSIIDNARLDAIVTREEMITQDQPERGRLRRALESIGLAKAPTARTPEQIIADGKRGGNHMYATFGYTAHEGGL
jgi:hypothetical protein